MRALIPIFISFYLFVGCGQQEVGNSSPKGDEGPYSPAAPIQFSADFYAEEGREFSFLSNTLFAEDVSSNHVFAMSNFPSFLGINSSTGELTGEAQVSGLFEDITITATSSVDASIKTINISLAVNGDPLRPYAWHLKNNGQTNFATASAVSGYDINVYDVIKEGVTGEGVRVAVSDSGAEINHDDLYENMLSGEHRDYSLSSPFLGDPVPTSAHGTAVTGILNARGWNNHGSIGVAPEAKTAVFQFLDSSQSTELLISQASGDFDIFNFSYGDVVYQDTLSDPDYLDHIKDQVLNHNKVYVKAAGNEFMLGESNICVPHNANMPFENESPYILLVGAINAAGGKSSYSNAGSNLWITAPGGEFGITYPAIMTTDLPTCFKGYAKATSSPYNDFEYQSNLNPKCHYTSTMNGTSSATPTVAGVIALMLDVNSSLNQRDIKHILAVTAARVDPDHDNNYFGTHHPSIVISGCDDLSLSGHTYEQGWIQNNAGFYFNNFYGFGLVDAKAAVEMTKTYVSSLGALQELNPNFNIGSMTRSPGVSIPDNSASGVSDTLTISSDISVESVQVKINISHASPGQLGIELTGPTSGGQRTKSILLNVNNSLLLGSDQDLNVVLASHAFYGESSAGDWTIRVIDAGSGTTGVINSWSLNILGH